ncbi:MAG: hypothetical protein J7K15_02815 [Deltaproteobacteria bacterium]|nr:hypothetical protein [Deltaproteobacteria bacterium]
MKRFKLVLAGVILLLVAGLGFSAQKTVTISWNRNTETDMAQYEVYLNDSLIATVSQPDSGDTVSWTGTVNISDGDNVAKVIAVDEAGNKSQPGLSNSVNPAPAQPTGCTLGVE